jgi:uncharacterized protein (TIGR02453 family)
MGGLFTPWKLQPCPGPNPGTSGYGLLLGSVLCVETVTPGGAAGTTWASLHRQAIVDEPDRWRRATRDAEFRRTFELAGESLKRPPQCFPADHPLIDDLKRTDFAGIGHFSEQDVLKPRFPDQVATAFAAGRPLMRLLCKALKVPF